MALKSLPKAPVSRAAAIEWTRACWLADIPVAEVLQAAPAWYQQLIRNIYQGLNTIERMAPPVHIGGPYHGKDMP